MGGDAAALADSPLLFPDDEDEGPAARVRRHARRSSIPAITERFVTITGG